jgi:hypothetical protein
MRACRMAAAATLSALVVLAVPARAEDPKYAFGKKDEVAKAPPWTASVTFGFGATTGNSQTLNLSGAVLLAHRFDPENMLTFDARGVFGRSTMSIATDANADGQVSPDEVVDITQTVAQAWGTRLRYDRFFDLNSVYGFVYAAGDTPAGKPFMGGVQVGYSRALYKTATAELVGEAGVDFTYQRFAVGPPDSVNIAGLRAYLGYVGTPLDYLSYSASLEWFGNLSQESTARGEIGPFGDNRLTGKLALNWKIFGNGSLGFNFRALYNTAPAVKPPPPGLSWAPGYFPLANSWDTFTELVLVYKLL